MIPSPFVSSWVLSFRFPRSMGSRRSKGRFSVSTPSGFFLHVRLAHDILTHGKMDSSGRLLGRLVGSRDEATCTSSIWFNKHVLSRKGMYITNTWMIYYSKLMIRGLFVPCDTYHLLPELLTPYISYLCSIYYIYIQPYIKQLPSTLIACQPHWGPFHHFYDKYTDLQP